MILLGKAFPPAQGGSRRAGWFPQDLRWTGMEMRFLHTHQGSLFGEDELCWSSFCILFELGRSQKCHVARGMLHCQNTSLSTERKKQCELIGKILPDQTWVQRIPPLGHLVLCAALGGEEETTSSTKTCPESVFLKFSIQSGRERCHSNCD